MKKLSLSITAVFIAAAAFSQISTTDTPELILIAGPAVNNVYVPPDPDFFDPNKVQTAVFIVNYSGSWPADAVKAFEYAVDIWEKSLTSSVNIVISASYHNLGNIGVLGAARAYSEWREFAAPHPQYQPNTWFTVALANSMIGIDLDPANVDMYVNLNSQITDWYFGTDGQTPDTDHDFVTVAHHEIAHGLGFFSTLHEFALGGPEWSRDSFPNTYDRYIVNGSGTKLTSLPLFGSTLTNFVQSNNIFWDGAEATTANGSTNPKLYAPATWLRGSSISHLDEVTFNPTDHALMTPVTDKSEAWHNPGSVGIGIMKDIGWQAVLISDINDEVEVSGPLTFSQSKGTGSSVFSPIIYNADYIDWAPVGNFAVSWSWNIQLFHIDGTYDLIANTSGSQSDAGNFSSYTISSAFTLPDLHWARDADGNILGKVNVFAIDDEGDGHGDDMLIKVKVPPNKPFVSIEQLSCTSLEISSYSSGATSYEIYYGTSPGVYNGTGIDQGNSPINIGSATTFNLTGLTSGTRYYFAAKGFNPEGSSVFSDEVDNFVYDIENFIATTSAVWEPGAGNNPFGSITGEVIIGQKLTIPAGIDITIKGMNFKFGPEAEVIVQGKLTSDASTFESITDCGNTTMWNGVKVEDGGEFITINNSAIYDAITGISGTGTNAIVKVDGNTFFERNKEHIKLISLNNADTYIRNSTFSHQQTLLDISISNNSRRSIILNNCLLDTAITLNTFIDGFLGIDIEDSKVDIRGNIFHNQHHAIVANGMQTGNFREVNIFNMNTFNDINGIIIWFAFGISGTIENNIFNHNITLQSHDIDIRLNSCVSCGKSIIIKNNTFNNHIGDAVFLTDNSGLNILIDDNTFNAVTSWVFTSGLVRAINVVETSPASFASFRIRNNIINDTKDGIKVTNVNNLQVFNNIITFSIFEPGGAKTGIELQNCPFISVDLNQVSSNSNPQPSMVGIKVSDCGGASFVQNNLLDDLGCGLLFAFDNIGLIPEDNNINNCDNAIVLYFNKFNDIGQKLGTSTGPVDNPITNSANADYVLIHNNLGDVENNIRFNYWYMSDYCTAVDKYFSEVSPGVLTEVFPCRILKKKPAGPPCGVIQLPSNVCAMPLIVIPPNPVCDKDKFRRKYLEAIRGNLNPHQKDHQSEFVRKLVEIQKHIAGGEFAQAAQKLIYLPPACEFERRIKDVLETFVNIKMQDRTLTQAEKDTLITIAENTPDILRQAVALARAVLKSEENMDIEDHLPVIPNNNNARIGVFNGDNNETTNENIEIFRDVLIQIYPNPVTGNHINIQYRLPEKITAKVEIYDIAGRQNHHLILIEGIGNTDIDLSDLNKGLYIYFITINNEPYIIDKLIVE
ncbi:MAG: T9SS type A sorting domain-containing protein [Cytophagales bacterium]|nr:T9SS type A sorting domain-containing protein [Cytophagales bacterium]